MTAQIIDGKAFAARVRDKVAAHVTRLAADHGLTPGLAVVLVGEDPASQVYVRNKGRQTKEAGMLSVEHRLPETTSEAELLRLVEDLNEDPTIHGILVQLPLPDHVNADLVINAIAPAKDVDGFHFVNIGKLSAGHTADAFVPCTPAGCILMIEDELGNDFSGLNAVVIGRSNIVGKPMAALLLQRNATVTMTHSRTKDLPGVVRNADIVIAAVGRPDMVKADWVKPGAVVIDVGINRVEKEIDGEMKTRLTGDVDYDDVVGVAGAVTPVPGGVGPMTITMLMFNTLRSARLAAGLDG